jgi:hypothetical protein
MSHEQHSKASARLPRPWLLVAQLVLLAISVLALVIYIVGTPVYFAQLIPSSHHCLVDCPTSANIRDLHALGISITTYAAYLVAINLLFALTYFVVAALIFWRKSDDLMALLASFSLVALGASFPGIPSALAAVHPAWQVPVTLVGNEDVLAFPSIIVFFFLFPNGRFVPRWTIWMAVAFVALFELIGFFPASSTNFSSWPKLLIVVFMPLLIFGSLVFAQIYRYRHVSTRLERQQTKWIVYGMAVALLGFLLLGYLVPAVLRLFNTLQSVGLLPFIMLITGIYLVLLLIPLSLALAILRYRLWDVDVLINKTLVYGILTGTLAAVYVLCVLALQALLRGLFHQNSEVAIVVSTLLVAALFQPLRRRVQALIDRRFYRRKYDAARTLAAFSSTLRNEVDLNRLSEQLVEVVQETMQPGYISLWLRKTEGERTPKLERSFSASTAPAERE